MTNRAWMPLCAAGALAWLAAGCASRDDVPLDAPHAVSTQKAARAVHHWDVLAQDVAAHVAARLRDWPAGAHPLHVVVEPRESGFNAGFRKLLTTHLVERGVALSTEPSAVALRVDTQLVQHHAGVPLATQGAWLADGVYVVRGAEGLPAPAAAGGPLRTEILVTTSIESEGRILVRTADAYSIAQDDAALYQAAPPPPPPTPLKTWRVAP